jgi:SAM-dependent methyltransferase
VRDLDETRAFFGPRAATWNAKFGDDAPAYQRAVDESAVPAGAAVLDLGCGTGRAFGPLRTAVGARGAVVGIDVTPEMLEVAARQPYPHALVLGDAGRLPFRTAVFDLVFASGIVNHLRDPAGGLAGVARVTRPGGALVLFHPTGRATLAARRGHALRGDEPLSPTTLPGLLAATGWRLDRYDDADDRFYARAERIDA